MREVQEGRMSKPMVNKWANPVLYYQVTLTV